jgi:hypothetical protein
LFMVQRCKFSIELKNFPPDLSGEPKKGSYGEDITRKNLLAILCKEVTELYTR